VFFFREISRKTEGKIQKKGAKVKEVFRNKENEKKKKRKKEEQVDKMLEIREKKKILAKRPSPTACEVTRDLRLHRVGGRELVPWNPAISIDFQGRRGNRSAGAGAVLLDSLCAAPPLLPLLLVLLSPLGLVLAEVGQGVFVISVVSNKTKGVGI